MDIGIVGLPQSGKTTVFNAVTRGQAEVAPYAVSQSGPNVGVAKVPDLRLETLEAVYRPRRVVPAQVSYLDIPASADGSGPSRGIAGQLLNHLQGADALLVVARSFDDPAVAHVDDDIDPVRDIETVLLELSIADIEILDRRLARLEDGFKGARAPEREVLTREQSLMTGLKAGLEAGSAVRLMELDRDEARVLEGFQLLTAKPVILAQNAGEEQIPELASLRAQLSEAFDGPGMRSAVLCGKLEMELAQMDPADEREFRESLGAGESGLDQMLRLTHEVAGLATFFTGNDNEVRAWTTPEGTPALKAAGKVHTDFERGFIRAEVVAYTDLADCGSIAEARRRGVLRQEGKEYVVQDGDVLNILFNV